METISSLESQGWLRLNCKIDSMHGPISILSSAFNDFLERCGVESQIAHEIRTNIKDMMKPDDVSILAKYVPCLNKYFDDPMPTLKDFKIGKAQMHELFCHLLECLSRIKNRPVVFFVDDLQWADTASIHLLLALTKADEIDSTGDSPNVLFIGSYRDNEVDDNPSLVQMIDLLRHSSSVEVTNVAVNGFDIQTLSKIVSQSLCLPLRKIKPFCESIMQKTDGIVIHMIELIDRLVHDKILLYSLTKGWEWDNHKLEHCPISDNVAELFASKLNMLSWDVLRALQICSLFWQMEQRIIGYIQDFDGNGSVVDFNASLEAASELGLIKKIESPHVVFTFAHDIIAQVRHISELDSSCL